MKKTEKISDFLWVSSVTLVILLFTFPAFSTDYGPGLDPSFQWGLNWLFAHNYSTLTQLVYPFGPLAFLEIPTCEGINFILFLLFFTLMKIGFVILGFIASGIMDKRDISTSDSHRINQWLVPSGLLFFASYFTNIGLLIIYNCILLSIIHIRQQKWWTFVAASTIAILALFIKVSVGVNALSVVAISIVISYFVHKNVKLLAKQFAVSLSVFLLVSFILLHHPRNVISWYTGICHLIFGYGSLNLYYHNHLIYLLFFFLSLLVSPFICKNLSARYLCFLSIIPMFAFWKHGIIREDCWHYFGTVYFVIIFWLILTLLEEQRRPHILLLGTVSVLSLLLNAAEMDGYQHKLSKDFCGVTNLTKPFFHHQEYVANTMEVTNSQLQKSQLPDTMLGLIKNSSIDIYPFEFSYAAQNHLNWQPRAALGTALSTWIEAKSAQNFSDDSHAVRYLLWHFQQDHYGKRSASMDQRYFLNDEPKVVRNIINNYEPVANTEKLMLLSHTETPALEAPVCDETFKSQWTEWIEIPKKENTVVRVKVYSHKNLAGKVRSFLYKDISYLIEYQATDGEIYSYHYDPELATEGLWCAPFIQWPCDTTHEPDVIRFRLITDNPKYVKDEISLQFEYMKMTGRRCLLK